MVEHMDFNGNDQYGCDTCGRLFWRLADCPRVSSYKTGIIFGLRERVYVNQCLSCKRMAGQQRKTTSRKTTGGGRSIFDPAVERNVPMQMPLHEPRKTQMSYSEKIRNNRQPTQPLHPLFDPQAAREAIKEEQKSQMTQAEIDNAAKMSQEKWQNIENLSTTIIDSFFTFLGAAILFWIGIFLIALIWTVVDLM